MEEHQTTWPYEFSITKAAYTAASGALSSTTRRLRRTIPADDKTSDVACKINFLEMVQESYDGIVDEIQLAEMAMVRRARAHGIGEEVHGQVYREMIGILTTLRTNINRALGLPDTFFGGLFRRAFNFVAQYPRVSGATAAAVGGAAFASGSYAFYVKYGYCALRYILHKVLFKEAAVCASKAAVGAGTTMLTFGLIGAVVGVAAWAAYRQWFYKPDAVPVDEQVNARKELSEAVARFREARPQELLRSLQELGQICAAGFGEIVAPEDGDEVPGDHVCAYCFDEFSATMPAVQLPQCRRPGDRHLAHWHCLAEDMRLHARMACVLCGDRERHPGPAADGVV